MTQTESRTDSQKAGADNPGGAQAQGAHGDAAANVRDAPSTAGKRDGGAGSTPASASSSASKGAGEQSGNAPAAASGGVFYGQIGQDAVVAAGPNAVSVQRASEGYAINNYFFSDVHVVTKAEVEAKRHTASHPPSSNRATPDRNGHASRDGAARPADQQDHGGPRGTPDGSMGGKKGAETQSKTTSDQAEVASDAGKSPTTEGQGNAAGANAIDKGDGSRSGGNQGGQVEGGTRSGEPMAAQDKGTNVPGDRSSKTSGFKPSENVGKGGDGTRAGDTAKAGDPNSKVDRASPINSKGPANEHPIDGVVNPSASEHSKGKWPTLDDINRNLERVNRYGAMMMGPFAIAGRSLGKGLADAIATYTKDENKGKEKFEALGDSLITSNIPVVGTIQAVRGGTEEVKESVAKADEASAKGDSLAATGHYVDAGLAGLETITVVAGDVIAHAHAPGKIYAKAVEPKAPKFVEVKPVELPTETTPSPPRNPVPELPSDSAVNAPLGPEARATWIHDRYGESIVGNTLQPRTFEMDGNVGRFGSRVADHFDPTTGTLYEFNTTPWQDLPADRLQEKVKEKIGQAGKDFELRQSGRVNNVIWYGTSELPTSGPGAELRTALADAGIEYRVVPLPTNLAPFRVPVY